MQLEVLILDLLVGAQLVLALQHYRPKGVRLTRLCPECEQDIPIGAHKCAFCASTVIPPPHEPVKPRRRKGPELV